LACASVTYRARDVFDCCARLGVICRKQGADYKLYLPGSAKTREEHEDNTYITDDAEDAVIHAYHLARTRH
jgi:hypothetical protein